MPTTLAAYFIEELTDWQRTIAFYTEEMEGLTLKLQEVISRNSIPHIAEKVEEHQSVLNGVAEHFYHLQTQFNQQKAALKSDGALVDDAQIKGETSATQNDLRQHMLQAEKEYIEARTGCWSFLSGLFKNRNET